MKPVARARVAIRPSNIAIALTLLASVATAMLVLALTLPWWVRASIVIGCALQCAVTVHRLAAQRSVIALSADRRVVSTAADGAERTGVVTERTFVSAPLTCLVWHAEGQRFANTCVIAPDSAEVDERRQLRVVLRWGRVPQPEAEGEALAEEASQPALRRANAVRAPPDSHASASTQTPLSLLG